MKREYPAAPLVGVGGVVIESGRVLLVKRGREPQRGEWSLPGGALELGETLAQGVEREVQEETGLRVNALAVVEVLDRIVRDPEQPERKGGKARAGGRVRFHYVLVDFLCHPAGGMLHWASDARGARWVVRAELSGQIYRVQPFTLAVIEKAFAMDESMRNP